MRRTLATLLIGLSLLGPGAVAGAVAPTINLEFNGRPYIYYPYEAKPLIDEESGRLLIPLRILRDIPGTKWTINNSGHWLWFRKTWTLSAARMHIGTRYAFDANGVVDYELDARPRRIGWDLYVPARAAADLLDCYSEWRSDSNTFTIDCNRKAVNVTDIAKLMEEQPPRYHYERNEFEVPRNEKTKTFRMYPTAFAAYHWHLQTQNIILWSLPKTREARPLAFRHRDHLVWAEDEEGNAVYRLSGAIGLRVMNLWEAEQFRLALAAEARRNAAVTGLAGVAIGVLFPGAKEMITVRALSLGLAGLGAGYTLSGLRSDTIAACISESRRRYHDRPEQASVMVAWRSVLEITCIPEYVARDLTWNEIRAMEVRDSPWW